ncbi:expressed protein [Phakopsora pachyrhizi]|uniref:Expressed protein n=1 Tax=Phakopsora pachyrhizi TaxID=170000 RepID=A0AAV0AYM5_PHAPC|nr:expressed protein [Phakopsora pachyrhizi]
MNNGNSNSNGNSNIRSTTSDQRISNSIDWSSSIRSIQLSIDSSNILSSSSSTATALVSNNQTIHLDQQVQLKITLTLDHPTVLTNKNDQKLNGLIENQLRSFFSISIEATLIDRSDHKHSSSTNDYQEPIKDLLPSSLLKDERIQNSRVDRSDSTELFTADSFNSKNHSNRTVQVYVERVSDKRWSIFWLLSTKIDSSLINQSRPVSLCISSVVFFKNLRHSHQILRPTSPRARIVSASSVYQYSSNSQPKPPSVRGYDLGEADGEDDDSGGDLSVVVRQV